MGLRAGLCLAVVVAVAPPTIGGSTLGPDALEVVPATAGSAIASLRKFHLKFS